MSQHIKNKNIILIKVQTETEECIQEDAGFCIWSYIELYVALLTLLMGMRDWAPPPKIQLTHREVK